MSSNWFTQLLGQQRNNQLKGTIDSYQKLVSKYCRDDFALQDARNLVPIAELVQDNIHILEGDYQDNLLPILTQWFSNDFFTWFTAPNCEKCNSRLTADRSGTNPQGLAVETYKCTGDSCDYIFDFIRHNDPAILLHTRKGRCGEWANCYFLILRAMDYDARIVLDTTDHVWNEVWSESRQQWIHVDPCEAVVDCPLLYECGWSKKLEYCIAFSKYEMIDVTRRYTKDLNSIRRTRNAGNQQDREIWLAKYLDELTMQRVANLQQDVRDRVLRRRSIDLKHLEDFELKGRPDIDVSKLGGRKTGSIEWRIARGEYSPILDNQYIIKVQSTNKGPSSADAMFYINYNCDKNVYTSSLENLNVKGWQELIHRSENIDHKFERDWKTSYLARYESCAPHMEGKIVWRFDFSTLSDWTRIEIMIIAKNWPDTQLYGRLIERDSDESDGSSLELNLNKLNVFTPESFKAKLSNLVSVDLIITLVGGQADDSVAWQKPQLFRQVRGQEPESSFSIKIY